MEVVIKDKRIPQLTENLQIIRTVKYMLLDGQTERKISFIDVKNDVNDTKNDKKKMDPVYLKRTSSDCKFINTYFGQFTIHTPNQWKRVDKFSESILSINAIYEVETDIHYIKYIKSCNLNNAVIIKVELANLTSVAAALNWSDYVKVTISNKFAKIIPRHVDPFTCFIKRSLTPLPIICQNMCYIENISYISERLGRHYDFNPAVEIKDIVQKTIYIHPTLWVKPDNYRIIPNNLKREILIATIDNSVKFLSTDQQKTSLYNEKILHIFDGFIDEKTRKFTVLHPIVLDGKSITQLSETARLALFDELKSSYEKFPLHTFDEKAPKFDTKTEMVMFSTDASYSEQKIYEINYSRHINFAIIECPENTLGREPFIERPHYTIMLLFTRGGPHSKFTGLWDQPYSYFTFVHMPKDQASIYRGKICEFEFVSNNTQSQFSFRGLSTLRFPDDYDTAVFLTQLQNKQITIDSIYTSIFNTKSQALKDFVLDQLKSINVRDIKIVIDLPFKTNAVEIQSQTNPHKIYSDNPGELKYASMIIQYGDYVDTLGLLKYLMGGGYLIKIGGSTRRQYTDFKIVESGNIGTAPWTKYVKIKSNDADNPHASDGFTYKFARIHNENMPNECAAVNQNTKLINKPDLGALLCFAEFLTTQTPNSRVHIRHPNVKVSQLLAKLLPCFQYITQPTKENTDIIIMEEIDMKVIAEFEPTVAFCGVVKAGTYYEGRFILKPFSAEAKMYLRSYNMEKTMVVDPLVWLGNCGGYQKYRATCFAYRAPTGFDHCYDCRARAQICSNIRAFLKKNKIQGAYFDVGTAF